MGVESKWTFNGPSSWVCAQQCVLLEWECNHSNCLTTERHWLPTLLGPKVHLVQITTTGPLHTLWCIFLIWELVINLDRQLESLSWRHKLAQTCCLGCGAVHCRHTRLQTESLQRGPLGYWPLQRWPHGSSTQVSRKDSYRWKTARLRLAPFRPHWLWCRPRHRKQEQYGEVTHYLHFDFCPFNYQLAICNSWDKMPVNAKSHQEPGGK